MKAIGFGGFQTIFGAVYLALATNLALAIVGLPVLAILMLTDPAQSWPLIALTGPLLAPALAAAFATFAAHRAGERSVLRVFWRAWRRTFGRALAIGAGVAGALVVLVVDLKFFGASELGAVMVPVVGVLGVLVLGVAITVIAALADRPELRIREALKAGVWFGVRRWYLTLCSLAAVAALIALFTSLPAIAIGIAAAPLCYFVWANARYALRPILPAAEPEAA